MDSAPSRTRLCLAVAFMSCVRSRAEPSKNRLTILLFCAGACQFVDGEIERKIRKMDEEWVGCTFLHSDRPVGDEKQEVDIDAQNNTIKTSLPHQDIEDVRAVFMEWSQPQAILQLILKKKGNGLGRKFFDPRERRKFNESDLARWAQWIKNKVMTNLKEHAEASMDKKKLISVPQ